MELSAVDRKGLIRESYRIEGITAGECRTIFLDWALSLPEAFAPKDAISFLLDTYGPSAADHPMTQVLKEGLADQPKARRRGGRASRVSDET